MTMTKPDPIDDMIESEGTEIIHVETSAVGALVKSEVEAQLDAAHRYPRSVTRFLKEATSLATINQDVAESCIYSIPRDGKMIAGPSVRLAEIAASAYGNLHIGARVLDADEKEITAQGVAWDLERNLRVTLEVKRRITGRNGRRFSDDMVIVTGNAAASIALRNAIFRVVPRSYINGIYERVRKVAVGDAKSLDTRRGEVLDRLQKIGVSQERVLLRLGVGGVQDIGLEQLEVLIGFGTAIKSGEAQIDEVFPAAAPAPAAPEHDGKRMKLGKKSDPVPDSKPTNETAERTPGEDDR